MFAAFLHDLANYILMTSARCANKNLTVLYSILRQLYKIE